MRTVDSRELWLRTEQRRFDIAKDCPHLAVDKHETPCLWQRSYCLHPSLPNTEIEGRYEHCILVWHGQCPFGFPETPSRNEEERS